MRRDLTILITRHSGVITATARGIVTVAAVTKITIAAQDMTVIQGVIETTTAARDMTVFQAVMETTTAVWVGTSDQTETLAPRSGTGVTTRTVARHDPRAVFLPRRPDTRATRV